MSLSILGGRVPACMPLSTSTSIIASDVASNGRPSVTASVHHTAGSVSTPSSTSAPCRLRDSRAGNAFGTNAWRARRAKFASSSRLARRAWTGLK
jgi:hypothetical protein